MEKSKVLEVMGALSSGVRLDVYRLLVTEGPRGLVAGEIAAEVGLPLTNMSFHLKGLTQAGLATVEQEGRYQRYRANVPLMLDVIAFLTENCCAHDPAECRKYREAVPGVEAVLPALATRRLRKSLVSVRGRRRRATKR